MKGLSLPIETIVIVMVAVLVLFVVAAFFGGWFSSYSVKMQRENALSNACQQFRIIYNCNPDDIVKDVIKYTDIGKPEEDYSVAELCTLLGTPWDDTEDNACLRKCGCVVSTPTTPAPTTTT